MAQSFVFVIKVLYKITVHNVEFTRYLSYNGETRNVSLSAVVSQAIKWEFLKSNPLSLVDKPKEPPPRTRRYSQDEIDRLLFVSGFTFEKAPHMNIIFIFSHILILRSSDESQPLMFYKSVKSIRRKNPYRLF